MAKADWENDDFEPKVFQKPLINSDRWEGEDEDDDVKDNWDDEEEEEQEQKQETIVAVQPKKKKSIAQILAEKEEKRRKELEEKSEVVLEDKILTPEEVFSEKLRQQKLQEESDLELTKETFGVFDSTSGIDQMNPSTKEDFDIFRKELVNKITKYDSSAHYVLFLEDFCRDLCLTLPHEDIKKLTGSLNALAAEKQKAQKVGKAKKKSKKGTVNVGKGSLTILDYGDEFDDIGI